MGLSSEMIDCISTRLCPKCSRRIVTKGREDNEGNLIWCAELLLACKPKLVSRVGISSLLGYAGRVGAAGPTMGWTVKEPRRYNELKLSRDKRQIRKNVEHIWNVEVELNLWAEGPVMRCKLCRQDWSVGKWRQI